MKPLAFERVKIRGIEALLMPERGSGLAAASAIVRRGSADESAGEHGLASFTMSMLMRGTRRRSSEQMAFDLESLGAMASDSGGVDGGGLSVSSTAEVMPAALEILFEALREPAFDERELEVHRQEVLADLRMSEDDKFHYTFRQYLKTMFAGHGYGHPAEGEMADVEAINVDACRRWHAAQVRPESIMFVAVGDFESDRMAGLIDRLAADWTIDAGLRPRQQAEIPPEHEPRLNLAKPELQQGFIVVGYRTPPVTHPDYPALRLGSAVLGEGFGGRLFSNLRDRRSLAYAVGSMISTYRLGGHQVLYIGTKTETIDEAAAGLIEESEHVRMHEPDEAELNRAREYVIGKYLMGLQSHAQRGSNVAWWEDHAGDAALAQMWPDRLREVTPKQVREAAERWWVNPTTAILRPE
ncbi:insulinase family protein [bacterium]|nr:insulinase family protein [bacterium]